MCRINCKKELVGNDVWVACSGGVDSIVVAHYLINKLKRKRVKLFHFNHALRAQNWEMERSVINFAEEFGLPIEVRRARWDPRDLQKSPSENNLRAKRLESLVQVVGEGDIIYGHHLNDYVESYLMNTFKGNPEYVPIPIISGFDEMTVIRPFFLTPKKAFEKYAEAYNLNKFIVQDETNSNTKYRRNWVRNRLLPVIGEEYPGLEKVVFKIMVKHYDKLNKEKAYNVEDAAHAINWLENNS